MQPYSRHVRAFACAVMATGLAACASNPPGPAHDSVFPSGRVTTHVFVGNCVILPAGREAALAGLAAAILPSLISQTFDRIGRTLEASAKEYTWTVTAATNFETSDTEFPRCVQIVRGRFVGSEADANYSWASDTIYKQNVSRLKQRGIWLTSRPAFFFEGVFRQASGDPAVRSIVPVFVSFDSAIAQRTLRADPARNVKLAFAFHAPGKSAADASNPSTDLMLGPLDPPVALTFDTSCVGETTTSGATAPPAQPGVGGPPKPPTPAAKPPPAGNTASVPSACVDESVWFRLPASKERVPMSITVAVSEVQGASEFLAFVAAVFKDSQDELETLAKQALITSEREKARLAQLEAQNTASVAYDNAVAQVIAALSACSTDGAFAKITEARIKQQAANLAAEKAGVPRPFATLVPLTNTPETAKAACTDALKSFQ